MEKYAVKFMYSVGFPKWLMNEARVEYVRLYNKWATVSEEMYSKWNTEYSIAFPDNAQEQSEAAVKHYREWISERTDSIISKYPSQLMTIHMPPEGAIYGEVKKGGETYIITMYLNVV